MTYTAYPRKKHPYFTQNGRDDDRSAEQYIASMHSGSVAGFKYFAFEQTRALCITVGRNGKGIMQAATEPTFARLCAEIPLRADGTRTTFRAPMRVDDGVHALFFRFEGQGSIDFHAFELL